MAVREKAALRGAAAEGSGGGYISIRKFRKHLELKLFFFPPAAFLRALFFDTREISDFPLFFVYPTTTLPYTLGFSAGKLPGLASKVLYLPAAEPFLFGIVSAALCGVHGQV